jgi:hypothetical protein
MTNRSNISGNKPQQVRKPVPPKAKSEEEILDEARYAEMGKVAPTNVRASAELVGDAGLEEVRDELQLRADELKAELVVSSPSNNLKDLAKTIDQDRILGDQVQQAHAKSIEELEEAVNHRSGMSYSELKAAYEEYKLKAEEAGEMLNAVRTVINNPFHRYGQFVDSIPLGRALKMEKVWQPKESR